MAKQEILCTAVPAGKLEGGKVKLSVVLSPRLTGDAPEAQLSSFVFDGWPVKANELAFRVSFGSESNSARGQRLAGSPAAA